MIKAYASGGSKDSARAGSAKGQKIIADNMTKAGATKRQIRSAQNRAKKNGGQVQRVQ